MTGAAIVFFAYIGFDAVSTAAQEARNPQKDMPIGIIGSLLICTVLYILVSGIATGVMSYKELNVPDPIAVAADHAGLGWMSTLIKLGAIAGLSSVILVMLLGQSRVFWTMSRDGLLPQFVNKIHPKFQTPYITSIITGIIVAFFAAILPIRDAASLVSIGTLLAFVIVSVGVLVLRPPRAPPGLVSGGAALARGGVARPALPGRPRELRPPLLHPPRRQPRPRAAASDRRRGSSESAARRPR